jgi:CBS domain-containing protein
MRTIETIRRPVIVPADQTIHQAAQLMETASVGALLVVDDDERLVGIVTDRDIVRRGVAARLDLDARIDAVMSCPVVTIDAQADLRDAVGVFREHAIRRLPVVDDGRPSGMLTVDDLVVGLVNDLSDVVRPVTAELLFGHHDPSVPATT